MKKRTCVLFFLLLLFFSVSVYGASNSQLGLEGFDWVRLPDTVIAEISSPEFMQPFNEVSFNVNVPAGEYWIAMTYRPVEDIIGRAGLLITVDGVQQQIGINSIWADEHKNYLQDRFGNDIRPDQVTRQGFHTDFWASSVTLSRRPLLFNLNENSEITIEIIGHELLIETIYILTPEEILPFSQTANANAALGTGEVIILEAQEQMAKSHAFIGSANEQTPVVHPFEIGRRRINTAFQERIGEAMVWEFYVDSPGLYNISFRYSTWLYEDMEVYSNILINGQIPSSEFMNFGFSYTGFVGTFANKTAGVPIYLEAGWNTIKIQQDATILDTYYNDLRYILGSLNDIATELRRLAGISGTIQRHRIWAVEQYIPGVTAQLENHSSELRRIFDEFPRESLRDPAPLQALNISASQIDRLILRIDRLPANLDWITDITLSLADLVSSFQEQPILFDRIYIHTDEYQLASARLGFFRSLWQTIREFFHALFGSNDNFAIAAREEGELVVWVNRPIQMVALMQQIIDSRFTPESGIPVRLVAISDSNRLILSNASGTNPDAAVGILSHIPFEFAFRGAIADLTQFDDFLPFVEEHFVKEAHQAFVFGDGIYALAETKVAQMLFYRTDILDNLGLQPPDTWDDVRQMMPVLRRSGMNFFLPLSAGVGFKPFFATAPFIFQMGAEIYAPDGMSVALDTPQSLLAFELMTDLYRIYGLQDNVPSFTQNFRMGTMPIGVSDVNQMIVFRLAAPEIDGLWDIGLAPGVIDENGINRRYQLAVTSSNIIMESSEMKQEAWEFIRWWMSTETQIEFGQALLFRIGPEFIWPSANLHAFASLPFTDREREIILEQWEWVQEVPRHPASYMVERGLSNAWFNTVGDNVSPRIALDRQVAIINREILRRLEEFGYVENGVPVRDFVIRPIESFFEGGER